MTSSETDFELVAVRAGVCSLRSRGFGETFHPVVGPMAEARTLHAGQQRLVERAATTAGPFVIWDVGLGAAANALAVLEAFRDFAGTVSIHLYSFDETLAPLRFALAHGSELGYLTAYLTEVTELLRTGECGSLQGGVHWRLRPGDFSELIRSAELPAPHGILYDPYSPASNPGMWTLEHFRHLRGHLSDDVPCLLTNYTRSTAVRVTLLLAGFFVGRGSGVGEKAETTIASNRLEMLAAPLDSAWFDRVRRSTRSAPLRETGTPETRISSADLKALGAHPQFL